ncbi:MAG: hypothetical protein EWV50_13155 [Microcystis aeruginosa Ma_MB_F_20061100_S20]|nr:MAG: hypothetical protein EWV50_13155 [Microcystis aeruginosa Ma_MB_F_20061100_S20]
MGIQPRELNRQGNNNSHYYSTNDSSLVTQERDFLLYCNGCGVWGVGIMNYELEIGEFFADN